MQTPSHFLAAAHRINDVNPRYVARRPLLLGLGLLVGLSACKPESVPQTDTQAAPASVRSTAAAPTSPQVHLDAEQLQALVDGMLKKAYGDAAFDATKGCWKHSFETSNDALDYCMKAETPKVVATASGTQVYFQTYSDPGAGSYSSVDPGLRGLFAASVSTSGQWQPLAQSPAIDQGQAGDCGCLGARLEQVGPERYGWLSTSGGTWQGVTVTRHDLYVPVDGTFRNVSRIPQSTERAPDETIDIAIDAAGTPVSGMYPVKATRHAPGKADSVAVVAFDPTQQTYPWAL